MTDWVKRTYGTEEAFHAAIDAAHYAADRDALLEHARMGRSVPQGNAGKVVWITPVEIFARYGLDEFGREPAAAGEKG